MKYFAIILLLAAAITAGLFSVQNEPVPVIAEQNGKQVADEKPKVQVVTEGKPDLNPAPKKIVAVKPALKKKTLAEKSLKDPADVLDRVLEEKLAGLDSNLLKRRTRTLKEMFERLPNLSEGDKDLLAKLILLYDQNNYGSTKDEEFAGHIDSQIANLLGDDYVLFEQRSSYKMLNDLHNILKKNPLESHQEAEVVNYFNQNMDSGLINKLIAVEFNRNGFKEDENPLLNVEPIKAQLDIWKDAPVTEGQSAEMENIHTMLLIGLGRAQIEADLKKLEEN